MSEKETIVVIGYVISHPQTANIHHKRPIKLTPTPKSAGVIGLSTALRLQSHLKNTQQILLIARDFPNTTSLNYASPWAGAHYRPIPGSSPQATREGSQAKATYAHFKALSAQDPSSGVQALEAIEHLENPPAAYLDEKIVRECYAHLDGFRLLGSEECPEGVKWGARYVSFVVNPPVYCAWLLRAFVLAGGVTREYTVIDPAEAFWLAEGRKVRTVVNCSGMGFGDARSFIIRGLLHFVSSSLLCVVN
jgi:glycine/D-amino acid oxidase-like deaminating enzyme